MARRMFSPKIVESDAFLELPQTAQNLYFHLGMHADDDGFVNPRKVMRVIGSTDDDLRMLIGKRFVIPFENSVLVIKHWRINNMVRKDYYRETQYFEEKAQLFLKENDSYTDNPDAGAVFTGNGIRKIKQIRQQNVNTSSTQVRLGKDINTARAGALGAPDAQCNPEGMSHIRQALQKKGIIPKNK